MVQALCPVAVAYAESDNVTVPTTIVLVPVLSNALCYSLGQST